MVAGSYNFKHPILSPEEMTERMQMLRFKVQEKKIEEVWIDLTNAGFEPILIKGWAAAQFYPKPYKREFGDIDLVFDPQRYEDVAEYLKAKNFPHNLDLHRGLRRHDTLSFREIYNASEILRCGEASVRVPRAEDHLRILCVHWLTDGGAYREKLWDVYYAIDNRAANFDWDRFLNRVSPTRRRWLVCTIGLAHRYLGLPLENTPIADEALKLPGWLTKSLEREWASETKLQPLHGIDYRRGRKELLGQIGVFLRLNLRDNRRQFFQQMRKRLVPNPIYATVDVEGEFDRRPRILYQLRSFLRRLKKFGEMKDV